MQQLRTTLLHRFSFRLGLGNQFGWSAQQAIEKYIKGALLLNGMNISELGHDLDRAFREIKNIAPELIPQFVSAPNSKGYGAKEETNNVIDRFHHNGNTSQRYRIYGHLVHEFYFHYFDCICFIFIRLNASLDLTVASRMIAR